MKSRRKVLIVFIVLWSALSLSSCGPLVKRDSDLPLGAVRRVAVLPVEAPPSMTEARKEILRVSISPELDSKGYNLLDHSKVLAECAKQQCADPKILIEKYNLDGVFRIEVASSGESDFGLGYYNSLDAKVTLQGKSGGAITSVDHTESEGGGLLLDSGQVFQAIKEQLASSADATFEILAANFADRVVREFPSPVGVAQVSQKDGAAQGVTLREVSIKEQRPGVFEICAFAEGDVVAYIVSGRRRSNLRKVADNQYCARFRNTIAFEGPYIEVRSAFGDQGRKPVPLPVSRVCPLADAVKASLVNKVLEVQFSCPHFSSGTKVQKAGAQSNPAENPELAASCAANEKKSCHAQRVLLFASEKIPGPVTRLAQLSTPSYRSTLRGKVPNYIHLVALYEDGTSSPPYTFSRESLEGLKR